ncbi:MAG: DnaA N-terminal domain-containing protein, partial [Bacteroidota bacterium]|nr:DnaA N-terminal domain-containing protein [Bacteroidota bacterium]
MMPLDHQILWNNCLTIIKDNVPEVSYSTWFAPVVP